MGISLNCEDINLIAPTISATVGIAIGYIIRKFTLSKKDKDEFNIKYSANSKEVEREILESFNSYQDAMCKVLKSEECNLDLYNEFTKIGEKYLSDLKILCCLILAGQTHKSFIKDHLSDQISFRNIIAYYKTSSHLAKKINIKPQKNYSSVQRVHNIYLRTDKKKWCFKLLNFFGLYK